MAVPWSPHRSMPQPDVDLAEPLQGKVPSSAFRVQCKFCVLLTLFAGTAGAVLLSSALFPHNRASQDSKAVSMASFVRAPLGASLRSRAPAAAAASPRAFASFGPAVPEVRLPEESLKASSRSGEDGPAGSVELRPGGQEVEVAKLQDDVDMAPTWSRRSALLHAAALLGAVAALQEVGPAEAYAPKGGNSLKKVKIDESEFSVIPGTDPPLKYYDLRGGSGAAVKEGQKVSVEFDLKFRKATVVNSVVDGIPRERDEYTARGRSYNTGKASYDFILGGPVNQTDIDAQGKARLIQGDNDAFVGPFLAVFNKGMTGMTKGSARRLLVPPAYAWGGDGFLEIPPDATVQLEIDLLNFK